MLGWLWLPCLAVAVAAEDERRHRRGPEPLWGESWYFDLAADDGSVGGFVRLGLYPNLGVAWYWAALVGQGRRLVLVRDHEIELPRGGSLEVRGQGLWSAVNCETPLDHWSIGLEAFGVALDDPVDAFAGERGDLVGLGFDLEWEATAPAFGPIGPVGYAQACRVTGEILVGDEQLDFDGTGHRGHAWGVQDWWGSGHCMASGVLDDGATFLLRTDEDGPSSAYRTAVAEPGWRPEPAGSAGVGKSAAVAGVAIDATFNDAGLPLSGLILLGEGESPVGATALAHAPLLLEAPDGRVSRLARVLCLYQSGEGANGVGWAGWLTPSRLIPPLGPEGRRSGRSPGEG